MWGQEFGATIFQDKVNPRSALLVHVVHVEDVENSLIASR